MPSRVIRGEINSSESLSHVSLGADLTFRALLVAVDDFGRLDARPAVLKAALFPMRPMATPKRIAGWLEELVADGCVQLYEADGRPYLALPGWEKHRGKGRRAENSRFPQPPDFTGPREILGNPRKSNAIRPCSEGRGTLDEGREASSENRGTIKSASSDALCLCPETLTDDDWEKLYEWASTAEFTTEQCSDAFDRVHGWSHTSRKKRARWWLVTKNAMQDGWALKAGGNGRPPKSWAQQQEDQTMQWLKEVSDGATGPDSSGSGAAVPELPERSDGRDQDDIPF